MSHVFVVLMVFLLAADSFILVISLFETTENMDWSSFSSYGNMPETLGTGVVFICCSWNSPQMWSGVSICCAVTDIDDFLVGCVSSNLLTFLATDCRYFPQKNVEIGLN